MEYVNNLSQFKILTIKQMSQNPPQKKPISPSQLFQKLLTQNYKQSQCIDQSSQLKQQRSLLLSLITEYQVQIQKRHHQLDKLESAINLRNRLRVQLEALRADRVGIQRDLEYQMERNRIGAEEVEWRTRVRLEVQEFRERNLGLEVRLKELVQYGLKLERQNANLEKENIMAEEYTMRVRTNSDIMLGSHRGGVYVQGSWRQKIQARRRQQQKLNMNIRLKIQQKQQQNRQYINLKQAEIAEGNRRRMASFQQKLRKY